MVYLERVGIFRSGWTKEHVTQAKQGWCNTKKTMINGSKRNRKKYMGCLVHYIVTLRYRVTL